MSVVMDTNANSNHGLTEPVKSASAPTNMMPAALHYAQRGLRVLPLVPGEKTPLTEHGVKDATADVVQVVKWWTECPDANVGIACGAESGITVLDVDVKGDKNGNAVLGTLVQQHGALPETWEQMTWSGGRQFVFAYVPEVRNTAGKLGVGLDTRGDAGYVVAPPSVVNGQPYRWVRGLNATLASMPEWMVALLADRKPGSKVVSRSVKTMAKNGRNNALTSLAGSLRRRDASPEAVAAALHAENRTFPEPLDDREVDNIVASASRNFTAASGGCAWVLWIYGLPDEWAMGLASPSYQECQAQGHRMIDFATRNPASRVLWFQCYVSRS